MYRQTYSAAPLLGVIEDVREADEDIGRKEEIV